ncbi:hypothetical protein [Chitinophaga sp. S165]|uniref:hypothetical protein n=1 Tax=Chitinophaga sp. S165 TaxID=2135462 RepID=UPI000D71186E|nr:hypothetical protein [Chitinophaga sp. S165]PWV48779.1 hypothetical protein C7475_10620 [Chitinophaga sp. S165]
MTTPAGVTVRKSQYTVRETIDRLQVALEQHNVTIYSRIDQQQELQKAGLVKIDNFRTVVSNASGDEHTLKSSIQAMEKADELLEAGHTPKGLRFEDKKEPTPGSNTKYDVDLGIRKSAPVEGQESYLEAYQFKTNDGPLSKGKIEGAAKQLYDARADKRIVELILVEADDLANIEKDEKILRELKHQLYAKGENSSNNVIIDEFHFIFSNGEKIKVIWNGEKVEFIKF